MLTEVHIEEIGGNRRKSYEINSFVFAFSFWQYGLLNSYIIKKRNATFAERSAVSSQLADLLGLDQPLPVAEAIAEICYGVDICAQATSGSSVDDECNPEDYDDEDRPQFGSACYLKSFREQYRCSSSHGQMTMKGWEVFANILNDTKGFYITLIKSNFIEYYKAKFNVDLSVQANIEPFKRLILKR